MVAQRSILNRTMRRLRQAWSELNTTLRGNDRYRFDPSLTDHNIEHLRELIHACFAQSAGAHAFFAVAGY